MTDEDRRQALVADAVDRYGRIDVCVNNAGVPPPTDRPRRLRARAHVNVRSVFALSQAVARPMLEQGSGSIVNMSSMFSLVASTPVARGRLRGLQGAVNGLTRELANQWAARGVRVNAMAPGWFPTEMNAELLEDERASKFGADMPDGPAGAAGGARRGAAVPRQRRLLVLHGPGARDRRRDGHAMTATYTRQPHSTAPAASTSRA